MPSQIQIPHVPVNGPVHTPQPPVQNRVQPQLPVQEINTLHRRVNMAGTRPQIGLAHGQSTVSRSAPAMNMMMNPMYQPNAFGYGLPPHGYPYPYGTLNRGPFSAGAQGGDGHGGRESQADIPKEFLLFSKGEYGPPHIYMLFFFGVFLHLYFKYCRKRRERTRALRTATFSFFLTVFMLLLTGFFAVHVTYPESLHYLALPTVSLFTLTLVLMAFFG